MLESRSTETLINSFPMFGHPGISALEYAGTLAASKNKTRRASATSADRLTTALKRKSTAETHDDNTKTTAAAATGKVEQALPLAPVHYIDEFGAQRKRKGMFVNHTPRDFDMRAPQNIEVYRPSTSSSNENYSRPRINSQNSRSSSAGPCLEQKRLTVNPDAPVELDSTEVGIASSPTMFASSSPMSPEVYRPMAAPPHRRAISSPMTKIITYQPRQARTIISNSYQKREVKVRSTSTPDHDLKEKKQSRRQTPYKVTAEANTKAPYASLEPWVAKHERNASRSDTNSDMPTQEDLEKLEEVAPLGVIQKYFDSQADSRESSLRRVRHRHTPSPPKMPLPHSPDPTLRSKEPIAIFPIGDLELTTDVPPAVPERSPKRLTGPRFPIRKESITSVDSDFARAAEGQFRECDYRDSEIQVPKQRNHAQVGVGQAARAGSSNLGRMAPPILGHDALTASSDLGLNDLSYYLKHTGPKSDTQATSRQRTRGGPKIFKVKRKSLAARVGSVEGSPQRARQKPKVPTCTREMTTSAGAKHLKIVIPRLSGTDNLALPIAVPGAQNQKHRSRPISLSFTEDMLVPALASPAVERAIQGFSSYDRASRSFSAPNIMDVAANAMRKGKSPPISPKPIPVFEHPLAEHPVSREEQTKARKLRDLKKIRRKEVPSTISVSTSTQQRNSDTGPGALPTPRQTPEPTVGSSEELVGESAVEIEVVEEASAEKMFRLQERVVYLQRQNSALTAALAKVVGLEMENGDLEPEYVLQTFRRCRYSRTPSGW